MRLKADVISNEIMLSLTQYSPMAHMVNVQDFMITSMSVLINEVKKLKKPPKPNNPYLEK